MAAQVKTSFGELPLIDRLSALTVAIINVTGVIAIALTVTIDEQSGHTAYRCYSHGSFPTIELQTLYLQRGFPACFY
jgi:hypothetical protein